MGCSRLNLILTICVPIVAIVIINTYSVTVFDFESLSGLNVLVTGASSGIGEQVAYVYARHGANVVLTARREDQLKKVTSRCQELSPNAAMINYIVADMTNNGDPERVINEATKLLPNLDHLILNHGVLNILHWPKYNFNDIEQMLRINYLSHVQLATHALLYLMKTNGSIAVVGSLAARQTHLYGASYGASKAALDVFFNTARWENSVEGINVSITHIVSGGVMTDMVRGAENKYGKIFGWTKEKKNDFTYAQANETAEHIVKATILRERETYWPPKDMIYLVNIIRAIKPTWVEKMVEDFLDITRNN